MNELTTPVVPPASPRPEGRGGAGGLALSHVNKRYGDTQALADVSFEIQPGEVVGVVGHNGAGKSTLLRMLAGAERPDSGSVLIDGVPQSFAGPRDAIAAGISAVYQELSLVPQLTVAQSIFLGQERHRAGWLSQRAMADEAQELCDEFEIGVRADAKIASLPVAQRQLIEIVSAFHRQSRFLLLDEPTTALEAGQVSKLLDSIRRLVDQQDFAVVLINHKLDEVFAVADRVVAMSNGAVILEGPVGSVDRSAVVSAIVGEHAEAVVAGVDLTESPTFPGTSAGSELRQTSSTQTRARPTASGVADTPDTPDMVGTVGTADHARAVTAGLVVENVTAERLPGVDLEVAPGRVVALYGLMGSGRSRFLRVLAGALPSASGTIHLAGRPFRPTDPRAALAAGVAYVSEERKADGIIRSIGIVENVTLPVVDRYTTLGFVRKREERDDAMDVLRRMDLRGDLRSPPASLSGGNQQKLLLARTLLQKPRLLLLDEPTKGVDIGAKGEIHSLIRAMAHDAQLPVLVVSSEEEEVLVLADEVAIFRRGHCDGRLRSTEGLTIPQLRRLALSDDPEAEATAS